MPEDTTRCTCERCQLKDSTNQLRPSDEVLCDKCYQKERKQADEINVNETSTDIQNDENTEVHIKPNIPFSKIIHDVIAIV